MLVKRGFVNWEQEDEFFRSYGFDFPEKEDKEVEELYAAAESDLVSREKGASGWHISKNAPNHYQISLSKRILPKKKSLLMRYSSGFASLRWVQLSFTI